jgi:type I site-specific restriction-modification system R (restriction) subunit
MEQYCTSRDRKLLFQFKRDAGTFTVDPDEVYLTTKLEAANTRFLPFNRGFKNGAGNPPAKDYSSYRASYFWEEILSVDSWLELIGRFMHMQKEEYLIDGKKYGKKQCSSRDTIRLMWLENLQPMLRQADPEGIISFNTLREAARAIPLHGSPIG